MSLSAIWWKTKTENVCLGNRFKREVNTPLDSLLSPIVSLCVKIIVFPFGKLKVSCVLYWLFCADLAIDVPDFLDLSRMRATGLQAGEEELPDLMPPIVLPEDTRGTERVHFMSCSMVIHVHSCALTDSSYSWNQQPSLHQSIDEQWWLQLWKWEGHFQTVNMTFCASLISSSHLITFMPTFGSASDTVCWFQIRQGSIFSQRTISWSTTVMTHLWPWGEFACKYPEGTLRAFYAFREGQTSQNFKYHISFLSSHHYYHLTLFLTSSSVRFASEEKGLLFWK